MDNKIKSQKKVINLNCSYSVYSEKKIYEINSNIKEIQTTPFISPVHPQKKTQHNEIWFHDVSRFYTLIWFVWYVNKIFLIEPKKNQQK